ncbi:hypothetical protein PtB15_4B90 [Puccinia triticina]|nr:hypothetical protein PtB15_4B86 [Puccinia triticina]WAR54473.1 hypothetical protein PtB15_4B90 [Puccinia triticina]
MPPPALESRGATLPDGSPVRSGPPPPPAPSDRSGGLVGRWRSETEWELREMADEDRNATAVLTVRQASEEVPAQAAPLLHAFSDLTAAQGWSNVKVQTFSTNRSDPSRLAILRGTPPSSEVGRIVYPMSLHQPTNFQTLSELFPSFGLGAGSKVLLAIVSSDSSIVYYELSQGIVSPKEVPE